MSLLLRFLKVSVLSAFLTGPAVAQDVPLIGSAGQAAIVVPEDASSVVRYAVSDFNDDCREATGRQLAVSHQLPTQPTVVILPGVVGSSKWLDQLEQAGKIDLHALRGQWESYVIEPVANPFPGVPLALVVAGSDPRGAMYGLYDVSERAFGTDPQKFWTDAVPRHLNTVVWTQGRLRKGPPTFKFRGWFVNDEHGLLGWHHVAGQPNSIDAPTWAKIFETICRLRGNFFTLIEYGQVPDEASLRLASDRGLYVTGSHMHMLITNTSYGYDRGPLTSYWDAYCLQKYGHTIPYRWMSHAKEIASFWEDEGVKKHKDQLAIWTLGLKGPNDTDFQEDDPLAPKTVEGRARVTNEAVQLEQQIVERNLPPGSQPLYMAALRNDLFDQYRTHQIHFPPGTMVMWPDDPSFGLIRQLPQAEDFALDPNQGIFFHLTFCDNHWVQWVPLEQVQQQLVGTVNDGATSMVEFNVGDIREIPMKIALAMDLAWDAKSWVDDPNHWRSFAENWINREYQPTDAKAVADLFVRYWQLEMPVRSMIILERLSQFTVLRGNVLEAIANQPDKKAALIAYAQDMQVPTGGRFGKMGYGYIKQNAPNWNALWHDVDASTPGIAPERRQFYQDSFLLQVATSRLMNLWGIEIYEGFAAIKDSKWAEAAGHLEKATTYVTQLATYRHESEHGKWAGWFNGDQLFPWTNQMWGFHDLREAANERQLVALLRSFTPSTAAP